MNILPKVHRKFSEMFCLSGMQRSDLLGTTWVGVVGGAGLPWGKTSVAVEGQGGGAVCQGAWEWGHRGHLAEEVSMFYPCNNFA